MKVKKPKNPYQTYLHKQVSKLTQGIGGGVDFKDFVEDMVWRGHFEKRIILAGKHAIRYKHLQKMSDKQIKEQSLSDDEYQNKYKQPAIEEDPVKNKLAELCHSPFFRWIGIEEIEKLRAKIVEISCRVHQRVMTESEYNYFLHTPKEQILLKLELGDSELYSTRSKDLLRPLEKQATGQVVLKTIRLRRDY